MQLHYLLLSFCALAVAHPRSTTAPIPLPTTPTSCPASTPHVYVTKITTTAYQERHCPSFVTSVDTPPFWETCSFDTSTCTRPLCLSLSTITWPCNTDPCCTRTATDTSYVACPTKCPTGCATSWTVVKATCPPSTSKKY